MKKLLILISVLFLSACFPELEDIKTSLNPGFDIITVGESHIDTGCIITIDGIENDMNVLSNSVNEELLGEYYINYSYNYNDDIYRCERFVKVIDDVPPIVTLNKGIDTIKVGDTFVDGLITFSDNYDNDLEVNIVNSVNTSIVGRYTVTYTVIDDSLNETVVIRFVNVVE